MPKTSVIVIIKMSSKKKIKFNFVFICLFTHYTNAKYK
jgi:hypothetical protein